MNEQLVGRILGGYRVESLLGRGTRASVYRAASVTYGHAAALRVFDRDLGEDQSFISRFQRAVASAAALLHPHLLPINEYGVQEGLAYLARPYVAAGTLRNRLGAPLPAAEVFQLLRPIAAALDHAHQGGLVHGDVKPGSILLPAPDRPLLADMGLSQTQPQGNNLVHAARGKHYGTPEYLAPEQALGAAIDGRADLYALAVILYEAFAGRPPFRAEKPGDTPRSVIVLHLTATPPSPRLFNPHLDQQVEAVLLKALAKTPEQRFPTGAALFAALEQALGGHSMPRQQPRPVVSPPPPVVHVPPAPTPLQPQTKPRAGRGWSRTGF